MSRIESDQALLTDVLKAVSRSFYLSLRVLPPGVRAQIGLAYLLARTTDTIADTEVVPVAERLDYLRATLERISGRSDRPLELGCFTQKNETPGERVLLTRFEDLIRVLAATTDEDRERVRRVLETITSGQELDLSRFSAASPDALVALRTADELDDYTYRVAGCVGEFWTGLCRAKLFPEREMDETLLIERGVRFGKGLQLINILRDLASDLRAGRCYMPKEQLAAHGLSPQDLLEPHREVDFRPIKAEWIHLARQHLVAGWDYANSLPRRGLRLRLACAWPNLIGTATLDKLDQRNILDDSRRIKVSRGEVRALLFRSTLLAPVAPLWRSLGPR